MLAKANRRERLNSRNRFITIIKNCLLKKNRKTHFFILKKKVKARSDNYSKKRT
jgi:hypothetical protein